VSADRLEELRHLILKPDQDRLEKLRNRIESVQRRTADVAEVLPDSISDSFNRDERFITSLRRPVRQCIAESVRDEPDEFAAALFPVMGPAIRRSIRETLRAWTQQFSQALEHSLTPRGMRWRIEAWRAGVPFGRYVIQKTLVYRVEDVYLIHSETGLLVSHVTQNDEQLKDEDAISAMFTAIQSFVRDSFARDDEERLTTAELGDLTLWAVHGPNSTVVAVIRGLAPIDIRDRLKTAIEQIEREQGDRLSEYSGDREAMRDVEPVLARCLVAAMRDDSPQKRRPVAAYAVAAVAVLALLGWLGYNMWLDARARDATAQLAGAPGLVITDSLRDGRTITVSGLRDRLAGDPAAMLVDAGWTGEIDTRFRPFLSLDEEIVYARALNVLDPPDGVTLALNDATLAVSGTVSAEWAQVLNANWLRVTGVDTLDLSGLTVETAEIAPPATPEPEPEPPVSELEQLAELAAGLDRLTISFERGAAAPAPASQPLIEQMAATILTYADVAQSIGLSAEFTVTGHSDNSGADAVNRALELQRAASVVGALAAAGVPTEMLTPQSQLVIGEAGPREAIVRVAPAAALPSIPLE
jgi:OOP family OmpA-OmpF porin